MKSSVKNSVCMLYPTFLSLQIHIVFYDTLGSLISVVIGLFRTLWMSQIMDGKTPESKEDGGELGSMQPSSGGSFQFSAESELLGVRQ